MANNVRKAKSRITDIETTVKRQLDASIELPTATKKAIIANVKGITSAIDNTYAAVREPLTTHEETEKARKAQIETLLGTIGQMLHVYDPINGTHTPSAELKARLHRLDGFLPAELANEAKLVAALQDAQEALPDMIKNAEYQEKRDHDAAVAIDAAKKAEAKAEALKEMAAEAMLTGATVANTIAQQHAANVAPMVTETTTAAPPTPAPQTQLFSKEQRQAMYSAWMQAAADAGFSTDEELAKVKQFFNNINKGRVPYLRIVSEE